MSTRSRIGFVNAGESVATACYVHWDGSLSGVGYILKLYYTNPDKVKELISNGDLSALGKFVGTKHDFNKCPAGECNYYGRDRGEQGCDAIKLDTKKFWGDSWEEFNYLFNMEDGKWYWRPYDIDSWKELTFEDCGITVEERKQAYKELKEYKPRQNYDIDDEDDIPF